jgi:sugar lactone lactonase YvrE
VVADAAGNSVVRVSPNGRSVSTVGVLPPIPQELTPEALEGLPLDKCVGATYQSNPVPTDVEIGPNGDYYVSALPGFPESPGAGKVFKISRTTGAVSKVAGGFSAAVDLAVAADGTLYVAELFAGKVSKVNPGDNEASSSVDVPCPTAVEIGPGGTVLAAEGGICQDGPPGEGRIVRVDF